MEKKIEQQVAALWKRVDEAQKRSIEAKALAEYLNKNVIEAVMQAREAREIAIRVESQMKELSKSINQKYDRLIDLQRRQIYWTMGLIGLLVAIIKLL
ncbi:hypothetical protein Calab_1450 [Caldithrix abyssi DSM 13497]|uniref:Uncharacterized protein n=1 Tax=Caldithrix abyssi DSM 13497 TaxID=880073 RepID=H1XPU5_CALAY|nr:hypothetical protein [Caldithrix abyssi]APF20401.1 hypothetical protein Cabys_3655 [Caldithrix abyssi DSM 13497]EHO41071.1 hypothetical protein Calab_1450 [Caldithrix abyssi DSM 13497]